MKIRFPPATGWSLVLGCFSLATFLAATPLARAQDEFRAFWSDAFHAGFKSASEVTNLINDLRAANCNAVVVEVRKRGEAYYNGSIYEPHAADTTPADFDSLQEIINQAHDTTGGKQRIEVHAWLVSFKIWGSTNPPAVSDPPHPFNAHPEWLTRNDTNGLWDGSFTLDPGHPDVQRHTFNVCMDIISRYDVDGLNFDYIRYSEITSANGTNHWGYNPVAVARFNARYGRTGQPALNDPLWNQFRRDHITAFMRKIYLNAMALKPQLKISADTITWAPSVTTDLAWTNSARAYRDVLQDWRSWMEEGILDLNIPMNYFRHHVTSPNYSLDYTNWMNFAKDHKFGRHLAIGPGIYLNYISNGIVQLRASRALSPGGNRAEGACGYSYAVPFGFDKWPTNFDTFRLFLTNAPSTNDPSATPVFGQRVSIPVMPWKATPTKGHIKGMLSVDNGTTTNPVEGATITLAGPVPRTLSSDLTGFYGTVNLNPGTYTLTASNLNYLKATNIVTVVSGVITSADFVLPAIRIRAQPQHLTALSGSNATFTVAADSAAPLAYQWYSNSVSVITAATNAWLTLSNVSTAQAGGYSVRLTNVVGAITSEVATLTVYTSAVPTLSALSFVGDQVSFGLTGVPGFRYGVQASTNFQDWSWLDTNSSPFSFTNSSGLPYRFYRGVFLP